MDDGTSLKRIQLSKLEIYDINRSKISTSLTLSLQCLERVPICLSFTS